MLTQTLKTQQKKIDDNSVIIYLLRCNGYETTIGGLNMAEWVKKAIKELSYIEIDYDGSDLVDFLKPKLVNAKYSIILFSNTPLITTPAVLKVIEYVVTKQIKACKFNGGFAFNTEYLKTAKQIMFDSFLPLEGEDFLVVDNVGKLKLASKIINERIIQKHIINGVEFIGTSEIDDQVEIEPNVVIFSGNIIKGESYIGKNTILKEKNVIDNSIIGSDVCIASSNIINSKIEDNVFILPYCYVNKSTIRKNCYISSNISVENRTVRAGSKLKEN